VQVKRSSVLFAATILPELYTLPEVLEPNPRFDLLSQAFRTGIVLRPSRRHWQKIPGRDRRLHPAVHSVLTGEKSAPEAAAALEKSWFASPVSRRDRPLEDQHSKEKLCNRSISLARLALLQCGARTVSAGA